MCVELRSVTHTLNTVIFSRMFSCQASTERPVASNSPACRSFPCMFFFPRCIRAPLSHSRHFDGVPSNTRLTHSVHVLCINQPAQTNKVFQKVILTIAHEVGVRDECEKNKTETRQCRTVSHTTSQCAWNNRHRHLVFHAQKGAYE